MSEWYYAHGGEQKGPVPVSELLRLAGEGAFDPASDLVWREGMEDWKPAGAVPELKSVFEPAPEPEASAGAGPPTATPAATVSSAPMPTAVSPVPASPGPAGPAMPATSGQAIASMICGLVGFFTCIVWCLALPLSIVGIVMGHLASSKIRSKPEQFKGLGLARTGLITGYIGLLAALAVLAFAFWLRSLSPEELETLDWLPAEAREQIQEQMQLQQEIERQLEEGQEGN